MNLKTTYMGIPLENPVVVASCGFTKNSESIKQCEQAGAGAVVLKSLFEEQTMDESGTDDVYQTMHPEAFDYIQADLKMQFKPMEYVKTIREAKKTVSIPLIASINCHSDKWWLDFTKQLEDAGADALELNLFILPYDGSKSSSEIENTYIHVLESVLKSITIPVSLKLSPYFTSFGNLAKKFEKGGAKGLVLFNRFIQPDINIDSMTSCVKTAFDDPIGFMHALRWVGLLSSQVSIDIAASGNIRTADDAIKQMLAGAAVVQVASLLYTDGLDSIKKITSGIETWMTRKNFDTIADFKGKLSSANDPHNDSFIRAQFIKTLAGMDKENAVNYQL